MYSILKYQFFNVLGPGRPSTYYILSDESSIPFYLP